jgi:RNA polymerase sigma factor (sigma-70 family)
MVLSDAEWGELFASHLPYIKGLAKLLIDAPLREALVDKTLEDIQRGRARFQGKNFKAWVAQIMRNNVIDVLRAEARRLSEIPLSAIAGESQSGGRLLALVGGGPGVTEKDLHKRLAILQAIEALPADEQTLVTLFVFEELQFPEIAARVGGNVNTIKGRCYAAAERAAALLELEKAK